MKLALSVALATGVLLSFAACSGDPASKDGMGGGGADSSGGTQSGGSPSSGGLPASGGSSHSGGHGPGGADGSGGEAEVLGGAAGMGGQSQVSCAAPQQGEGGAGGASSGLSISGTYGDPYGGAYTFSSSAVESWYSVFYVVAVDEDAHYLIAQNDEDNSYFPCAFSRFDWHQADGDLYICQSAYGAGSADEAAEASADPQRLTDGCGGFPWSKLTAK